MCSCNSSGKSEYLQKLAEILRLYKPNPCPSSSGDTSTTLNLLGESKSQDSPLRQGSNRAAVLICLFEDDNGDIRVILTKRSSTLSSHSGEVALPGGKRDQCDKTDVETALREANEEIGLDPSIVDVVAILEPFYSKKNIVVFPVIGILWDKSAFKPVLNAAEVESIFDAPLEMFLKDENRTAEEREWMGYKYLLHFFKYQAENECYVIWAFTAGILIETASIVYQRLPDFQVRRPQFWSRSSLLNTRM